MPDRSAANASDSNVSIAKQGLKIDSTEDAALHRAIELACDYRGDVTIARKSTAPIEGYVYDCAIRNGERYVRMMLSTNGERTDVPISDIDSIEFTGKDTASGKSFETWIQKYVEKKRAGERASIESEPLDERDNTID